MGMLLACRDGLMTWMNGWQRLPCPLLHPTHVACDGNMFSAVDNAAHLLWHGGNLLPCPHDVEALRLWQGYALLLSSNTDSLAVADGSGWLFSAQAGMYPQELCLLGDAVLVCGGMDGLVHRLSLPELHTLREYTIPGMPQRITVLGDTAWVLSLLAEEGVFAGLYRLCLADGGWQLVQQFPGLPGALLADADGLWVGTTERLLHYPIHDSMPDTDLSGFGLIRHTDTTPTGLLVTDPLEGVVAEVSRENVRTLYRGPVEQACFLSDEKGASILR